MYLYLSLKAQQFKFSANTSIEAWMGIIHGFRLSPSRSCCLISQQIEKFFCRTNPCKVHRWRKFLPRISYCFFIIFLTYLSFLKNKELLSKPQQFFSFRFNNFFYFLIVFLFSSSRQTQDEKAQTEK